MSYMENHGGMMLEKETEELGEKPVLVPLWLLQIHMDWPGSDPGPPRWEAGE
jgi:hypothetical protein